MYRMLEIFEMDGAHDFVQNEANMCPVFMDLQNRACESEGIHHGGLLFLIEQKE